MTPLSLETNTMSNQTPEPIHHPHCARRSASGEFIFPDTACNCGGYRSLEDYLRSDHARGIVEHVVRVDSVGDGWATFYIHPANVDGDTLCLEVIGNRLCPDPKIGQIGATHPIGTPRTEPPPVKEPRR